MKKSLIALAALATVATAAQAQSSVTVYGVVDAGIRNVDKATSAGSATSFESGVLNTSRFGFRGTEDLGGGLKANFVLESGFAPGTGASSGSSSSAAGGSLFDRRSVVGLEGSFGKVDLGRNTTLTYDMTASYVTDPLGNELSSVYAPNAKTAAKQAINPVNVITGSTSLNTVRRDNAIKYAYTQGAVSLGLMYGVGGQAGDTNFNESLQASLRYKAHNIDLGAAYDELKDASGDKQKVYTVGGNVTVSGLKFTAGYHNLKADANFASSTAILNQPAATTFSTFIAGYGATKTHEAAVWNLGVGYNLTPSLGVVAAYYNTQYKAAGVNGGEYDSYIVRARYALSKRTDLYAAVDYTRNSDTAASASASGNANATGVTAGVQHRF